MIRHLAISLANDCCNIQTQVAQEVRLRNAKGKEGRGAGGATRTVMSSEIKTKERRNALPGVTEKTVQRSRGESVLEGEQKGRRELLIKNGKNDKMHQVNINNCTLSLHLST